MSIIQYSLSLTYGKFWVLEVDVNVSSWKGSSIHASRPSTGDAAGRILPRHRPPGSPPHLQYKPTLELQVEVGAVVGNQELSRLARVDFFLPLVTQLLLDRSPAGTPSLSLLLRQL